MKGNVDVTGVILNTQRLTLRPWEHNDLNDFYEYAKVDGVGQPAGWNPHKSVEETKTILGFFINEKKCFAIVNKENNKVIGSLGIEKLSKDLGGQYTDLCGREIGYVLSKDYWGKGIMTEAAEAVVDYCFNTLGFDFLQCSCAVTNIKSQRVIEKSGFAFAQEVIKTVSNGDKRQSYYYVLKK